MHIPKLVAKPVKNARPFRFVFFPRQLQEVSGAFCAAFEDFSLLKELVLLGLDLVTAG